MDNNLEFEFQNHIRKQERFSNLLLDITSSIQDFLTDEAIVREHEKHLAGRGNVLFVSFFRTDGKPPTYSRLFEGEPIMQIFSNNKVGLILTLTEFAKGAGIPLTKGPFKVDISDPGNTVNVAPGSDDQTTPTGFLPNGTGNTGTVTATVTDLSVTPPLVSAPASFDVIAPLPPPPAPDQLVAGFAIPATPVVIPPPAAAKTS